MHPVVTQAVNSIALEFKQRLPTYCLLDLSDELTNKKISAGSDARFTQGWIDMETLQLASTWIRYGRVKIEVCT